jgi:hypothetical protein
MEVSVSASSLGRISHGEEGWVVPKAGLGALGREKSLASVVNRTTATQLYTP